MLWDGVSPCKAQVSDPFFFMKMPLGESFGACASGGRTSTGLLDSCVAILSLSVDLVNGLSKPWIFFGCQSYVEV